MFLPSAISGLLTWKPNPAVHGVAFSPQTPSIAITRSSNQEFADLPLPTLPATISSRAPAEHLTWRSPSLPAIMSSTSAALDKGSSSRRLPWSYCFRPSDPFLGQLKVWQFQRKFKENQHFKENQQFNPRYLIPIRL